MALNQYTQRIRQAFAQSASNYEAHQKSRAILEEMARDTTVFHEILKKNMVSPDFHLKKRINPVIALEIDTTIDYSFIAHCWMPLPDADTETTHQSIHHHGNLLLTSIAPIGPGYSSILFKNNHKINKDQSVTLDIDKAYHNHLYNIEFIEVNTPHVVFYPEDFSVTYALWSSNKRLGFIERIKKSSLFQNNKSLVKALLVKFGFSKSLNLNVIENFDFFPKNGKIIVLKDRVNYKEGSAGNYYHNFCYILQKNNFTDNEFIQQLLLKTANQNNPFLKKSFTQFLNGEILQPTFEAIHLTIPEINFKREVLMQALKK
ncbi:MAG: hypothetical protein JWO58_2690 [Chitinophagaceae bacterium]|nr:hypothetical protein [Chitinophagaceae bacterium]